MQPGEESAGLVRIVLADDQTEFRRALRNFLVRIGGFQIAGEAADGSEAVEVARETQPDAIILDLAMPRMDGLQAIPEIRSVSPKTKIVVVSSMVDFEGAGSLATTQGADAVFEKNVRPEELAQTIVNLVRPQ